MREIRVYAPSGHLGHGFPRESLYNAFKFDPDYLGLQGTSMDPGPYYLGAGETPHSFKAIRRDLELIIPEAKDHGIPFIFSCTGPGTDNLVERVLQEIDGICKDRGLKLRVAVISGEIPKEYLRGRILRGDKIGRLTPHESLSETLKVEDVEKASRIVAQMGPEPIIHALEEHEPDIVCTGRALDTAIFSAIPMMRGMDKGLTVHMSKILECGAAAAEPSTTADGIFGILRDDHFLVFPTNPKRRATVASVAAHSLYERADPYMERGPDGYLDLSSARYEQEDERTVRVSGSRYVNTGEYAVKVEGAALIGYRSIMVVGARDPTFIENVEYILNVSLGRLEEVFKRGDYQVYFHVYGKDGVMGEVEPLREARPHEVGILVDVVAASQDLAREICSLLRSILFHLDYPGCKTTAGNLAFPFAPAVLDGGPVYTFNIWHSMPLKDPKEPFKMRIIEFPR